MRCQGNAPCSLGGPWPPLGDTIFFTSFVLFEIDRYFRPQKWPVIIGPESDDWNCSVCDPFAHAPLLELGGGNVWYGCLRNTQVLNKNWKAKLNISRATGKAGTYPFISKGFVKTWTKIKGKIFSWFQMFEVWNSLIAFSSCLFRFI